MVPSSCFPVNRQQRSIFGQQYSPNIDGIRTSCQFRPGISAMNSKYDHPALYSNDDAFWDQSYWDKRYRQDPTTFEWYRSYSSLQPILTQHLPRDKHILQIGVGTSRLQVDMADDGYNKITNTDYSPVAIQRLKLLYPMYDDRLTYAVVDARHMPQYQDASFYGVLDKGALDALLCGDTDESDAAAVLGEVWRLLAQGTAYVMITSASPRSRLKYLMKPATPWSSVLVYEVGQQGAMHGPFQCSGSSSSSSRGSSSSSSGSSSNGCATGSDNTPQSSVAADESAVAGCGSSSNNHSSDPDHEHAMKLPLMGYSHLVYVCYKPSGITTGIQ